MDEKLEALEATQRIQMLAISELTGMVRELTEIVNRQRVRLEAMDECRGKCDFCMADCQAGGDDGDPDC